MVNRGLRKGTTPELSGSVSEVWEGERGGHDNGWVLRWGGVVGFFFVACTADATFGNSKFLGNRSLMVKSGTKRQVE